MISLADCDVGESVFARCLSSLKSERVKSSTVLRGKIVSKYDGDKKEFVEHIRKVIMDSQCFTVYNNQHICRLSMLPR